MATSGCSTELNQLQNLSGCPDDSELMLFIAPSGYSGYSGYGVRDWGTLKYCLSGYSGYSGFSGDGLSGYSGFSGSNESGFSGFSGFSGSGFSGYSGVSGSSGISGFSGASGGGSGFSGYSGYSGQRGISGFSGVSGYSGNVQGASGFSGYSGFSGLGAAISWRTVFSTAYSVFVNASTTTYGQISGRVNLFQDEIFKSYVITEDCEVQNLFIKTSGTQPATGALIITVMKNSVSTALTLTIPANSIATIYSNITDSIPVSQGDVLSLQFQNLATSNSISFISSALTLVKF